MKLTLTHDDGSVLHSWDSDEDCEVFLEIIDHVTDEVRDWILEDADAEIRRTRKEQ